MEKMEQDIQELIKIISYFKTYISTNKEVSNFEIQEDISERKCNYLLKQKPFLLENLFTKNKNKYWFSNIILKIQQLKVKISSIFQISPSTYIAKLYADGYNEEQIAYILECLEDGITKKEIDQFIDPKIPVEMMKKLKNMKK